MPEKSVTRATLRRVPSLLARALSLLLAWALLFVWAPLARAL